MERHDGAVPHELTQRVIGCAYTVANELGCGFVEKVYGNALAHELRTTGLKVEQQKPMTVYYRGTVVGDFAADLLVADSLIVELKVASKLTDAHIAQCLNYLAATGKRLALLLNFGRPRIEVQRVINSKRKRPSAD